MDYRRWYHEIQTEGLVLWADTTQLSTLHSSRPGPAHQTDWASWTIPMGISSHPSDRPRGSCSPRVTCSLGRIFIPSIQCCPWQTEDLHVAWSTNLNSTSTFGAALNANSTKTGATLISSMSHVRWDRCSTKDMDIPARQCMAVYCWLIGPPRGLFPGTGRGEIGAER
jgi:hypothetical protein